MPTRRGFIGMLGSLPFLRLDDAGRRKAIEPTKKIEPVEVSSSGPATKVMVGLLDKRGNEISGKGYARQPAQFHPATRGCTSNIDTVTFEAYSDWGKVHGARVFVGEGMMVFEFQLSHPAWIRTGDAAEFAPGELKVFLDQAK